MTPMPCTLALAALPLALAVTLTAVLAPARPPAPRAPTATAAPPAAPVAVSEAPPPVRVIPLDARAFAARWPGEPQPQPRAEPVAVPVKVVRSIPIRAEPPAGGPAEEELAAAPPPVAVTKRAALDQRNICTRHGLRKIVVVRGRWKGWRCRR